VNEANNFYNTVEASSSTMSLLGLDPINLQLKGTAQAMLETATSFGNFAVGAELIKDYQKAFAPDYILTPTAASLIATNTAQATETRNYLGEANTKLNAGLNQLDLAERIVSGLDKQALPEIITNYIDNNALLSRISEHKSK